MNTDTDTSAVNWQKKRKKKRVINCSSRQGDEDIHANP